MEKKKKTFEEAAELVMAALFIGILLAATLLL